MIARMIRAAWIGGWRPSVRRRKHSEVNGCNSGDTGPLTPSLPQLSPLLGRDPFTRDRLNGTPSHVKRPEVSHRRVERPLTTGTAHLVTCLESVRERPQDHALVKFDADWPFRHTRTISGCAAKRVRKSFGTTLPASMLASRLPCLCAPAARIPGRDPVLEEMLKAHLVSSAYASPPQLIEPPNAFQVGQYLGQPKWGSKKLERT